MELDPAVIIDSDFDNLRRFRTPIIMGRDPASPMEW
jgi:hypothetical protein